MVLGKARAPDRSLKDMNPLCEAIFFFLFLSNHVVLQQPLFRTVDIDVGETKQVQFSDSKRAIVKLLSISETRDKARSAIRDARVEGCAT